MRINYRFVDKHTSNYATRKSTQCRPFRADEGAAGCDLYAVSIEQKDDILTVHTGIAVEIPFGCAGFLFPRSSVYKTGLALANCVGVIDSSYRGEIMCKFRIVGKNKPMYAVGERCCQLIIMPVPYVQYVEADELSDTSRGDGGFGSSGK